MLYLHPTSAPPCPTMISADITAYPAKLHRISLYSLHLFVFPFFFLSFLLRCLSPCSGHRPAGHVPRRPRAIHEITHLGLKSRWRAKNEMKPWLHTLLFLLPTSAPPCPTKQSVDITAYHLETPSISISFFFLLLFAPSFLFLLLLLLCSPSFCSFFFSFLFCHHINQRCSGHRPAGHVPCSSHPIHEKHSLG